MVVVPLAGAAAALAHEKSEQTVIKSREFTVPKGQCSQLPADLELKGWVSSVRRTVVESAEQRGRHESGDDDGRITYSLLSRITGRRPTTSAASNTFSYELRLKKPIPLPGTGIILDTFKLKALERRMGWRRSQGEGDVDAARTRSRSSCSRSRPAVRCDPL